MAKPSSVWLTVTCPQQETYHTQGRERISLVTKILKAEERRQKYRAKGEKGSFHIFRTDPSMFPCLPVTNPVQGICNSQPGVSHRFMWCNSWSISLDSVGYRLILCMVLKGKLWKRRTKRGSPLEGRGTDQSTQTRNCKRMTYHVRIGWGPDKTPYENITLRKDHLRTVWFTPPTREENNRSILNRMATKLSEKHF